MKTHFLKILESFVLPLLRGIGVSIGRMYRFFRHRPRTAIIVAILLIGLFIGFSRFLTPPESAVPALTRSVSLVRAGDESTSEPLTLIGEIRSVKEALVSPDSSGTVAGVYRALGDFVSAGTAIASLKNDRERAAVTQANAALAKAKAGATISGIGVGTASETLNTATIAATNALQSARSTVSDSVLRRTDAVFENPTTATRRFLVTVPSFNLVQETVAKRSDVQVVLDEYAEATNPSGTSAIIAALEKEVQNVAIARSYIDTLAQTLVRAIATDSIPEATLATYRSEANASLTAITALETSLANAEQNLRNAEAGILIAAEQNVDIGGLSTDVVSAQAALQNAQIALDRTIIRAPISGTINRLDLRIGDFVSAGSQVAYITNTAGLEIVAYVGSRDVEDIVRGAKTNIEGTTVSGTVSRVATALDPATKKAEVRVAVPAGSTFVPGQSVTLSIERRVKVDAENVSLFLPITTVKLTPDGAEIFTLSASSTLEAHPVTLGILQGSRIQILEGLDPDWNIVVDARGLSEGETVVVHE